MVQQSSGVIRLISCILTIVLVIGMFFIRIGVAKNVSAASSDTQTSQTFLTLERYNIIRESPVRTESRQQNKSVRMPKLFKSQPVSDSAVQQTERAENDVKQTGMISTESEHSQNETAETESPQNVTAETEHKPSGGLFGKKSNKKVIEYTPNFTIDKMPVYPMSARRLGQQGTVGVTAYIDGSGKVLNVVAAKSSGVKSLDEAAIAAVRCWSFGSLHLTDKMNIVRTEIVFKLE